jgi:tetratricopeptide (TPR) repeat protein
LASAIALVILLVIAAVSWVGRPKKLLLSGSDLVLLSDSINATEDPVFDNTLKQAVSFELTQSPYLNLLPQNRISSILQLMTKPTDSKVTAEIAQDLCKRAGAKAYITPSIASFGQKYLLSLTATNCTTGELIAQEQATANSKDQILSALDEAGSRFRNRLGESLASIKKFDVPLEQATTSSLQALEAYSIGNRSGSDSEAIPLFKRAVELDPYFALAYDGLGIAYSNLNEPALAKENIQKAYSLRERASERERFRVTTDHFQVVTGELDKANSTAELWAQVYPRDHYPHNLLGVNYEFVGYYQRAVTETLEALRLNPDDTLLYSNLMEDYAALGQFNEAKATYALAVSSKRDQVFLHADRYGIAFLENDIAEMQHQLDWARERPGSEDWLLSYESDTKAYHGRVKAARELTFRAEQSALRSGSREVASLWVANSALREAECGEISLARRDAFAAFRMSRSRDVKILTALALARAASDIQAEKLANELAEEFPLNTVINAYWLPTIRAAIELDRGHAPKALEWLREAQSFELGGPNPEIESGRFLYPVYVRGQAYLEAGKNDEAAHEFQKMLDHPGLMQNCPLRSLAYLQLARSYSAQHNLVKARAAFGEFFGVWKDADPEIPLLKNAREAYAKLP